MTQREKVLSRKPVWYLGFALISFIQNLVHVVQEKCHYQLRVRRELFMVPLPTLPILTAVPSILCQAISTCQHFDAIDNV